MSGIVALHTLAKRTIRTDMDRLRAPRARRREAGTAILITLLLIAAMLGGGATLLGMQLRSSRSAGLVRQKVTSQSCAEGGLAAARPLVIANYGQWTSGLCNPPSPAGTGSCVIGSAASEAAFLQSPAVDHDLDNNGTSDFVLTLVDNEDETATNDMTKDNDLQVWVISTCTSGDVTTSARELVRYTPGGTCYQTQLGGCGGGGNSN